MRPGEGEAPLIASEVSRRTVAVTSRSGVGRVHSVFRRCFNVVQPSSEWLTVGLAPFPRTPDGIIVTCTRAVDFKAEGLVPGAAVCCASGFLSVPQAGLRIRLRAARIFDTRRTPLEFSGARRRVARNLVTAWKTLDDRGRQEGLGWARAVLRPSDDGTSPGGCDYPDDLCRRAVPAIMALRIGIRSNDAAAMQRQVETLLGLGVGLTPSGDDVLGGLAAGLFLGGVPETRNSFVSVLREVLRQEGRTTEFSAHALRCIVDGEIPEIIHNVARDIGEREESDVERAMATLLSYGSTSGTEIALGLCLGVGLAAEPGRGRLIGRGI